MDPIGLIFFALIALLVIAAVVLPQVERSRNQK